MANIMYHIAYMKHKAKRANEENHRTKLDDPKDLSPNEAKDEPLNPTAINTYGVENQTENYQIFPNGNRIIIHRPRSPQTDERKYKLPSDIIKSDTMNALVVRKQSETALSSEGESRPTTPTNTTGTAVASTSRSRSKNESEKRKSSTNSLKDMVFGYHDDEDNESGSSRFRRYWNRITKIASSQLGLLVILVAYSFLGAAIFQAIEGPHEQDKKDELEHKKRQLIQRAWDVINNGSSFDNYTRLIEETLDQYEKASKKAFEHGIMAGDDMRIWDYWGSLFFSTTVFTTVGYGHIAPATSAGRIATMLYATIGIPLFFVVMANLGRLLTRFIKYLWSYVRKLYYTQTCRRIRKGKILRYIQEKLSGNKVNAASRDSTRKISEDITDTDSYVDYQVDDHFNLHPLVAITITILYIFFGALMYVQWEPWTYLEAFYFIFVSVSTIGFGDLIPEHPRYFLASSVYILLGLSLVAMVINVMMEFFSDTITKAKEKVENMRRSIGLDLDKLESMSSKRKHPLSTPKESKDEHTVETVPDIKTPHILGETNAGFSSSELHLNNNDICKDSGYADNTLSSCSSEDEIDYFRTKEDLAAQSSPTAKQNRVIFAIESNGESSFDSNMSQPASRFEHIKTKEITIHCESNPSSNSDKQRNQPAEK